MKKYLITSLLLLSSIFGLGQSITRNTPAKETDNTFSGNDQFLKGIRLGPKTFVNLPTDAIDGQVVFCSDCQTTNPCLASGPGAFAYRSASNWSCTVTGGGSVGPGTTGKFPKFGTPTSLVDSLLTENGSLLSVAGSFSVNSNWTIDSTGFADLKNISNPVAPASGFVRVFSNTAGIPSCIKSDGSSCGFVGPGSVGSIPVFNTLNSVGNSVISQSSSAITISGTLGIGNAPNDTFDVGNNWHINSTGYSDIRAIADPGNPGSGFCRLFADPSGNLTGHKSDGTSCLTGGGGGSAGGSTNQVQINGGGGSFAGSANLTFVGSTLTIGQAGAVLGQLQQGGSTSGIVTLTPQAVAGTVTLTYPNQSGTLASSAALPIILSATSGAISCPTCAQTTGLLNQFQQTNSAQLAGVISDETGSTGLLVFNASPTLITPVIASFLNAAHNHTNGIGGGQLTDAALSTAVGVLKGGTNLTAALDDNIMIGNGTTWQSKALVDCQDGAGHLNYTASSNSITCGTSGGVGGGANTALSNLLSVAFNADLTPDSNNTRNLGSPSVGLATGYFATAVQSPFYKSSTGTVASVGLLRGANNSTLVAAAKSTTGDCSFGLNSSDQFFTDCPFVSSGTATYLELGSEISATTGSVNTARLTYNDSTGKLRVSLDGASPVTVVTSAETVDVLASSTSAQLKTLISDETGSGFLVFATSPTLVTPTLGVATATTVNKVTFTTPATGSTLTILDGKTLTVNNTITLAGTDAQTYIFPTISATMFGSTTKHDVVEAGEFCADAGSTDTYVCSLSPAITAYITGVHYRFLANTSNTGAASINLNSLGAKTIVKYQGGAAQTLADNDIRAGAYVETVYDGTNMQLVSILGNTASTSGDVTDVGDCSTGACFTSGGSGTAITFHNATSGTLILQTVAGALGAVTVSLPDATDTLVGKATTDTLSNKTLDNTTVGTFKDTNLNIVDDGDVTKIVKFQISGVSTGTTRTLTIPDASTTLVGIDTTQTLTNKTLTAPVISTIVNTGTVTLPTATDTLTGKATTDTFTNKTLNAESTGNVLAWASEIDLPVGSCQNTTAALLWDTPTTNPAVAACDTGTNTQKGTADFADGALSLSIQTSFTLPDDWTATGGVDAKFKWFTSATTNSVVWQIATICVADASTSDPAFNTASTATDAAKGTTLQDNDATITGITVTGCTAGSRMYVKVFRDPANGSDTLAATARLREVILKIRHSQ